MSKQPFSGRGASLQPLPGLPNHYAIIERGYLAGILEVNGPYQRGFSSGFNGRSVKELQEMVTGDLLPPYVEPADWPAWCREREAVATPTLPIPSQVVMGSEA